MALPIQYTTNKDLQMMQTKWKSELDPVLANPTTNSLILKGVSLSVGVNVINHRLGRKLQGWKLTRQRSMASIYDDQDTNQSPELTLILVSNAATNVDIEVF